ncbi:MAG: hypothetical protein MR449_06675 [Spirochaetia bacterium]|nr:hypothetical protein [Spirochaetia bacterium]
MIKFKISFTAILTATVIAFTAVSCASVPEDAAAQTGGNSDTQENAEDELLQEEENAISDENAISIENAISDENAVPIEEPEVFEEEISHEIPKDEPAEKDEEIILEPVAEDEGYFITEKEDEISLPSEPENIAETLIEENKDIPLLETAEETEAETAATTVSSENNEAVTKNETPAKESSSVTNPETAKNVTPKTNDFTAAVEITENETEQKDLGEENYFADEDESQEEELSEQQIVPSRSVTMNKNQYLDIVYPGSGWIYIGELNEETPLMRYFGRKIGTKDTNFTMRSRDEGITILHFYKNDALTDDYIDDYLEVIIKGKAETQAHAVAPEYSLVVPPAPSSRKNVARKSIDSQNSTSSGQENLSSETEKTPAQKSENSSPSVSAKTEKNASSRNSPAEKSPEKTSGENDSSVVTVIQRTESNAENSSSVKNKNVQKDETLSEKGSSQNNSVKEDTVELTEDEILKLAQESFEKKEYARTLEYLDSFFDKSVTRIDEGLFLQAQTYEATSPVRNIKNALDTYQTLVDNYPQSINWSKASERLTYLKRFYFNIR